MSARIGFINNGVLKTSFLFCTNDLINISESLKHYKKLDELESLIGEGDMKYFNSSLNECCFYNRDFKEPYEVCKPYEEECLNYTLVNTSCSPVDFYFINDNKKWFVCEGYSDNWVTLTKFINSIKNEK